MDIINKTETGTAKLNVTKIITCEFITENGFSQTILQGKTVFSDIQFVPVDDLCQNNQVASEIELQDLKFTVTGNNPFSFTFPVSDSGVIVTLGACSYGVGEIDDITI